MSKKNAFPYTSIGGQAVIEGVMMRNPSHKTAMAVRSPKGNILIKTWEEKNLNKWYKKTPFIRGVFNFIDTLRLGYGCLMDAADMAGMEEEPTEFEKKLQAKLGRNYSAFLQTAILLFSLAMVLLLFVLLPTSLVGLLRRFTQSTALLTTVEGMTKLGIFLFYLAAISKMPDIRRVFQYHGAEHKTIACFEHHQPLTVENVQKHSRFHPRCGTSFLVIVLLLSILVNSFITWGSVLVRIGLKILVLPVVMSLSYEIIRFAGRHDNLATRILSAPGLWTQRLTTREPDPEMMEVAIQSMVAVLSESQLIPGSNPLTAQPVDENNTPIEAPASPEPQRGAAFSPENGTAFPGGWETPDAT